MDQTGLYACNDHLDQVGESKVHLLCSLTGIFLLKNLLWFKLLFLYLSHLYDVVDIISIHQYRILHWLTAHRRFKPP